MLKLPDRFMNKVKQNPQSGCWEWQGAKAGANYGQLRWPDGTKNSPMRYTHRIVASLKYNRELTSKDYVCHTCDNPQCCNPDHLWIGTSSDNIKDSMAKGRFKLEHLPVHIGCNHRKGYCKHAV